MLPAHGLPGERAVLVAIEVHYERRIAWSYDSWHEVLPASVVLPEVNAIYRGLGEVCGARDVRLVAGVRDVHPDDPILSQCSAARHSEGVPNPGLNDSCRESYHIDVH